jgi:putative endonuclease
MEKLFTVYILASQKRGTLYTGVTSNLLARLWQHREEVIKGFSTEHQVKRLVHVEFFGDATLAIQREKQLKRWRRPWKIALIERDHPGWRDLALDHGFDPLSPPLRVRLGTQPSPET